MAPSFFTPPSVGRPGSLRPRSVSAALGAAALVVTATVVACSGEDEPASRLDDLEGFCEVWAEQACNDTVVLDCAATDVDACRSAQASFCESLIPEGKYSRAGADACLGAVAEAYEDGRLESEEAATVLRLEAPCDKVISGSGSPGDSCADTTDCSTEVGLACIKLPGAEMGMCGEPDEVGGGLACTKPNAVCAQGFYCNGENCIVNKTGGQECSESVPCAGGFQCLPVAEAPTGDAGAGPGTADGGDAGTTSEPMPARSECVAQLDIGEPCDADSDCLSGICSAGSNPRCTGVIPLSAFGDSPVCDNLR